MSFLEEVPAIRRIDTDRSDLFAVDIVGQVTPAGAENLFGLIEAACTLHPKIDALVRLVDYESIDWQGISKETLERGKETVLEHVQRCATVGGPNWIGEVDGFFTTLPIEIRYFDAENEIDAWAWLGASPVPTE